MCVFFGSINNSNIRAHLARLTEVLQARNQHELLDEQLRVEHLQEEREVSEDAPRFAKFLMPPTAM